MTMCSLGPQKCQVGSPVDQGPRQGERSWLADSHKRRGRAVRCSTLHGGDPERSQFALLAQSRNRAVRETIASRDDVPLGVQAALGQDDAAEGARAAIAAERPHYAFST